eukprot:Opistho-2@62624
MRAAKPISFAVCFLGYSFIGEILMTLWERYLVSPPDNDFDGPLATRVRRLSRQSTAALRTMSDTFAFARPRSLLHSGRFRILCGQREKGMALLSRSVHDARRARFQLDEGLGLMEVGKASKGDVAIAALELSKTILRDSGAAYESNVAAEHLARLIASNTRVYT